jgi:tetratricopeptide (TPR) repeat protein
LSAAVAQAKAEGHDEGGRLPAFALLGLACLFLLAPDSRLLDLKRAFGFAFEAAGLLWLAARAFLRRPLGRPNRLFLAALGAVAVAYGLAWALSPYPQAASFRLEALALGLLGAVLAASLPPSFNRRFYGALLACALLTALYGLAQRLGLDPLQGSLTAGSRERAMASFGNATFLAAFLCFSWPLALLLHSRLRLVALLLFSGALLATQSRAGVLAAALQGLILGRQAWRGGWRPRWQGALALALVLALAAALLFPWAQWARATLRPQLWAESLRLILQRPFTGWGPGSFPLALQEHESAGFAQALGQAQFAEHPHNWVLSILHEAGILGLVAFAFLLAVVQPWPMRGGQRHAGQRALALGLLGLLLQNLFDRNLDQASLGFCFFFGLGLLSTPSAQAPAWPRWSAGPLLALALVCTWAGARPVLDYEAAVGPAPQLAPAQGDVAALRAAVLRDGADPRLLDELGTALVAQSAFAEAAGAFGRAEALQASAGRAINLGNCQLMLGQALPAEASFRRAIALAPLNADAHFSLGYALFCQKRLQDALAELDAALKLDPGHAAAAKLKEQILR